MYQGSEMKKDLHDTSHTEEEVKMPEQDQEAGATTSGRETEGNHSMNEENSNEDETASSSDAASEADQQPAEPSVDELMQRIDELEQQNRQLEQQNNEHEQRILRLQADFDNFRRRARNEKEELQKFAALNFVEQLLPIADNFERAISSSQLTKDFDSLSKGIEMINTQLFQLMEKEGIEEIKAVGQPFDPEFHQAVMQVESEEHEEGTVVEELQKGYLYNGRIIRPAMVKVSK